MPLIYSNRASAEYDDALVDTVDKQGKKIEKNEELTKFFTIIVAVTLVGTLFTVIIGMSGLYLTAFYNAQIQHEDDIQKDTLDRVLNEMMKISEKTYANENQQKLLKQKNPYLK